MSNATAAFLAQADRIGGRLCRDAIWSEDRCGWMGWSMDFHPRQGGGQWAASWRALGPLLYDGSAGIGLFLARLWAQTGDPIALATARAALNQSLTAVEGLVSQGEFGFYSGLAGLARACIDAGALIGDQAIAEGGAQALRAAAAIAPHPQRLDVINGAAGVIGVFLAAARGEPADAFTASAIRQGEHLLALAHRAAEGWSWDTLAGSTRKNLVGYSHGTAGIACALANLAQATGRADFREGALQALAYERHSFVPARGNWPDFRDLNVPPPGAEPACMIAWCHGAPGIGLGRLRLLDTLPDDHGLRAEVDIAVATSAASFNQTSIGSLCLCHGDTGNADLLIEAADRLARPDLRAAAETLGLRAIAQYADRDLPWPCGVPGAGETPNLMLGLAGIGYFYLRLHDPAATPSILLAGA